MDSSVEDDGVYGPSPLHATAMNAVNQDQDDDDDDDDDDTRDQATIPVSSQIRLSEHIRPISAVSLDAAGARLVTGSRDCTVKLWDFHGMDSTLKSFRTLTEPCGGNPIRDIQFSVSGDRFLIASGAWQAKLYDREGGQITEYNKGDPYLRDQRHTKGHVSALTGCRWHPFEKNVFLTASLDSTIRIWDSENKRENTKVIFVKSKERGGRTPITASAYSLDGKVIAAVGLDGELRLWNSNGPFLSPTHSIEKAHIPGNVTSCVNFSIDNVSLITRSMDDTLKLWDMRAFKKPVGIVSDLPSLFEEANAIFSPDNKHIITGTCVKKGQGEGRLCFFDRAAPGLSKARDDVMIQGSVIRVLWHSRINQVIATTSEGAAHVFYDEHVSAGGAKLCAGKRGKTRHIDDFSLQNDASSRVIINPHALPMFREDQPHKGKRKFEKLRKDPVATRNPDRPISGPGRGGKVGSSLTQHIVKDLIDESARTEDPREAILKHAEVAASNPVWVDPAYKKNQPKAVMAAAVFEDEEEEMDAQKKKRPK